MRCRAASSSSSGRPATSRSQRCEHLDHVAGVRSHAPDPEQRPAVQVEVTGLGHRHLEATTQLGQHRADDRPLLFEGVDVSEEDVQFEGSYVHSRLRRL